MLLFLCKQTIMFESLYVQTRICMNNDLYLNHYAGVLCS